MRTISAAGILPDAKHYRPDIDGLRATAVLCVVFSHFRVPGFTGGFLGVDIFFVISGYLITGILTQSEGTLGHSLLHFYERRIRRIVPALAVVLGASTIAAWMLVSPIEMRQFGGSLAASGGFVANFYFQNADSSYFAPRFETPLLHLWSLSVEEQFYLLYPVAYLIARRYAPKIIVPGIIITLIVSFALSEWLAEYYARAGFYSTASRAWELMVGAAINLNPFRKPMARGAAEFASGLAFLAIVLSVGLFRSSTLWPGWHAAIPVAASATLIAVLDKSDTAIRRVLASKLFVAVGLISYSLYLWHWPILEFFERYTLHFPRPGERVVLVVAALLAAWISWRFVERPFRKSREGVSRRALFVIAATTAMTPLVVGIAAYGTDGFPLRFPKPLQTIYSYINPEWTEDATRQRSVEECSATAEKPYSFERCFVLSSARPNVVLFGDSTGKSYYFGLREQAQLDGVNLVQATYAGCNLLRSSGPADSCLMFRNAVLSRLGDQRIAAVLFTTERAADGDKNSDLVDILRRISSHHKKAVMLGVPIRYAEPVPFYLVQARQAGNARALNLAHSETKRLLPLDESLGADFRRANLPYISVIEAVCHEGVCPMSIGDIPLQKDRIHLTIPGSQLVGRLLWPRIKAALSKPREN